MCKTIPYSLWVHKYKVLKIIEENKQQRLPHRGHEGTGLARDAQVFGVFP